MHTEWNDAACVPHASKPNAPSNDEASTPQCPHQPGAKACTPECPMYHYAYACLASAKCYGRQADCPTCGPKGLPINAYGNLIWCQTCTDNKFIMLHNILGMLHTQAPCVPHHMQNHEMLKNARCKCLCGIL